MCVCVFLFFLCSIECEKKTAQFVLYVFVFALECAIVWIQFIYILFV